METILEQVKTYDMTKLREELLKHDVKVGPIAPATKFLFQKRLANKLFELQGGVRDEFETDNAIKCIGTSEPKNNCVIKTENSTSKLPDVYYAVCLPENIDQDTAAEEKQLVFADKEVALKTAKKYKGSRFKVFKSQTEANVFSRLTAESAFQSPKKTLQEDSSNKEVQVSTESCMYKAPKPQEVAQLRKFIDIGDVETFKKWIWNNPRYLVSSGDTPVIYQEGCRYTAMHVAAIKNKPEICQAILDTLEEPQFVTQLYSLSVNTEGTQNNRINFLVDLYLNMPDKGNCESPLHLACKFGHELVVQVLVAHPRTDKFLKNKWGDSPKDIICTRCSSVSASTKQRIELLLQGQCYVPLVRSDDNCTQPVIGQPWSPDVTKSPLDMPKVSWSPRDPAMSIKACAGPMSPSNAEKFHKRWTTPPSQSPDQARKYFNTKRSDSEKGLERIGRQLANEMQVPWMEYWDFLGTFLNLATMEGLDALEEYFRKRIWFMFVKQFKDKHGIHGTMEDFSDISTPVKGPGREISVGQSEKGFDDVIKPDKTKTENPSSKSKIEGIVDVVSPVTGLSQSFAQLQLLDESWSDKATINTVDKSITSEDLDSSVVNSSTEDRKELKKDEDKETNNNKAESCLDDDKNVGDDVGDEKGANKASVKNTEMFLGGAIARTEDTDNFKNDGAESAEVRLQQNEKLVRINSTGSDSTASYATAVEEIEDSSLSGLSEFSDTGDSAVCIRLMDKASFDKLKQNLSTNKSFKNEINKNVKFLLRLKRFSVDSGLKVDILSIPELENVSTLMLLEDVVVSSCDGDIGGVQDGEVVEVGVGPSEKGHDEDTVKAYLTHSMTLPKIEYIHGPQPTREDLNISRALGDVFISPENHPNVFYWKIKLSRFLSDTNYRWQSPAKLKSKLRQASPQPSPLMKTSPIISYGSPLGLSAPPPPRNTVTSDIRTKLFHTILE